jgi:hypothetical protein
MCARMKHLPKVMLNGQPMGEATMTGPGSRRVAFYTKGDTEPQEGFLNGHARNETLAAKYPASDGWKKVSLPAAEIEERGQWFACNPEARVVAVVKEVEITQLNGEKVKMNLVNVVTRGPMTSGEAAVHSRWPFQVKPGDDGKLVAVPFVPDLSPSAEAPAESTVH